MRPSEPAATSVRLIAVEHFEGDGRIVDRVWQTFHYLTVPVGKQAPDRIDIAELEPAFPERVYSESGRALT